MGFAKDRAVRVPSRALPASDCAAVTRYEKPAPAIGYTLPQMLLL